MSKFLSLVVNDLYKKAGKNLSEYAVIFPNKRAGVFFRKYLTEIIDKPIWLPEIFTIQDFIIELSGVQIANKINLLFDLFGVYKSVFKKAGNFDDFYFWGEMLLNDFDDIDKYFADPKDVFQNVSELKSIDDYFSYLNENQVEAIKQFWKTFKVNDHSGHQKDFIKIWDKLYEIYQQFNILLNKKGYAYEGMIFRNIANKAINNDIAVKYDKIAVIGFNALNKCEIELFKYLQHSGRGIFYWDYDQYYLDKEHHQASFFIRKFIKQYTNELSSDYFKNFNKSKNIEIISVPSQTGQAMVVSKLLEEKVIENTELIDTAIILADENLLMPLLFSIPGNVNNINVTMGYPVRGSNIYCLLENLETLQKNCKKDNNEYRFYFRDIISVLSDSLLPIARNETEIIIEFINKESCVYLNPSEICNSQIFNTVFKPVSNAVEYINYLLHILNSILSNNTNKDEHNQLIINHEIVYQSYLTLNKFKQLVLEHESEISLNVLYRLIKRVLASISVPFVGEPLSGLQIMGLLESRNLDFDNVIVLSANEGVLPSASIKSSYIPYNLRKAFNLPLNTHYDSIIAYHFYRLIQRARNIYLLYSSDTDVFKSGEMSRFLYQLLYESNHNIQLKQASGKLSFQKIRKIEVKKDQFINDKLLEYTNASFNSYLSPTAVINFIECKLKFYFKYIKGLKEKEEVIEEIDHRIFGNLFHDTMYGIYKLFVNKLVNNEFIDSLLNNNSLLEQYIHNSFSGIVFMDKSRSGKQVLSGKNILLFNILKNYIENTLKYDKKIAPFKILSLEKKYLTTINIRVNNNDYKVKLGGTIDRVDQKEDIIRIIDYKTGGDNTLKIKDIESLFNEKSIDKFKSVFQTFLYAYIVNENETGKYDLEPGLYYIQKMANQDYSHNISNKEKKRISYVDVKEEFSERLQELVSNIFDENLIFKQTEDINKCKFCAYNQICHRT